MKRPYINALECGIGLALILVAHQARAQTLADGSTQTAEPSRSDQPSRGSARSTYVSPYIELTQTVTADLTNGYDVLTYSQVAAGIDAGIATARAEGQVSYRYERRIAWDDNVADYDVHSGLARGAYKISRELTVEGGALATRARSDIRGAAPGVLAGNVDNITQVYSVYAGPTFATKKGPVEIGAAYRLGYTKVEAPNATGVRANQLRRDFFGDSTSHVATATVGVAAGTVLPVGVTVSGAYEREDASQLDQSYEGKYVRGDVVLPVSRTVAVRAGVGYEKIQAKQRDALVNAAGNPVLDKNGRFVTDPNSPERIAYNTDGLIYDAGVIWRPSPRLQLQANAGWRYGSEIYTGSLSYQMSRDIGLQVVVYDGIQTFGRQLRDGLADLPTSFTTQPDPFGQQFGGCVFGSKPGQGGNGAGGCLNDAFQSISTASYRARGIDAVISATRGRTSYGFGAGYARRKLYAPRAAPGVAVIGTSDESYYGQAFYGRALSRVSSFDANLFVNYYDSGLTGIGVDSNGVFGAGATGSYSHSFGRLGTIASVGVYTFDQDNLDAQWSAQALLGARYQF